MAAEFLTLQASGVVGHSRLHPRNLRTRLIRGRSDCLPIGREGGVARGIGGLSSRLEVEVTNNGITPTEKFGDFSMRLGFGGLDDTTSNGGQP